MGRNKNYIERRRGPDIWVKIVKWSALVVWGLIFFILLVVFQAKPQVETFFDRLLQVKLRNTWDTDLLMYSFFLMIALFAVSSCALLISSRRNRRKEDKYSVSLVLSVVSSVAGIILYLYNLWFI